MRWWRLKYRIHGKEKRLSLGVYPAVTLAQARAKREEARALIAAGTDPSETRKADQSHQQCQQEVQAMVAAGLPLPDSFESVAREWFATRHADWSPGLKPTCSRSSVPARWPR